MASRRHRIGSDTRSDGESWVLMTLRAGATTQMSREAPIAEYRDWRPLFCAAACGGPEKAHLRRCRTSKYRFRYSFRSSASHLGLFRPIVRPLGFQTEPGPKNKLSLQ